MLLEKVSERISPYHNRWVTSCDTGTNGTMVYREMKPAGTVSPGMEKSA